VTVSEIILDLLGSGSPALRLKGVGLALQHADVLPALQQPVRDVLDELLADDDLAIRARAAELRLKFIEALPPEQSDADVWPPGVPADWTRHVHADGTAVYLAPLSAGVLR
jgi:hypothetical protein